MTNKPRRRKLILSCRSKPHP